MSDRSVESVESTVESECSMVCLGGAVFGVIVVKQAGPLLPSCLNDLALTEGFVRRCFVCGCLWGIIFGSVSLTLIVGRLECQRQDFLCLAANHS